MSARAAAWLVVFDGCPYTFATANVSAVVYPSGESPTGTILVSDVLVHPTVRWRELLHPTDGSFEYSGFTLSLHDASATKLGVSTGPAAGQSYFVSYLATRKRTSLMQTSLAASITGSPATFALAAVPSGLASSNFVLWIDQEAILVSSRSGTTCTVGTRGYYGTRQVDHTIDVDRGVFPPIVYGEFPGFAMRRVSLFLLTSSGTATLQWRGYCTRAPSVRGATVEVTLQSAWEIEQNKMLGRVGSTVYARGVGASSFYLNYKNDGARGFAVGPAGGSRLLLFNDFEGALNDRLQGLRAAKAAEGGVTNAAANASVDSVRANCLLSCSGGSDFHLEYQDRRPQAQPITGPSSDISGGLHVARLTINEPPRVLALVESSSAVSGVSSTTVLPITSVLGLPTASGSWDASDPSSSWSPSVAPYTASVRPALVGKLTDDVELVLTAAPGVPSPLVASDTNYQPAVGPTFTCVPRKRQNLSAVDFGTNTNQQAFAITDEIAFRYVTFVDAGHWAVALRAALTDTSYVQADSDPRNWSWSTFGQVLGQTSGANTSVQWVLDGTKRIGEVIKSAATYNGCCIGVRNGYLSLIPMRFALASETPQWTITSEDLTNDGEPEWVSNLDGIVNQVRLKGRKLDVTARDARSIAAYGEARVVEIDADGLVNESPALADPITIAQQLLQRSLGLWGEVTQTVRVSVPIAPFSTLALGDTVALSCWLVPDSAGGRGLSASSTVNGIVLGREPDTRTDSMTLTVLLTDTAYGYAPCVRLSASSSGTSVVVATGYMNGSDYSRSDDASYPFASTFPLDGGTSWWMVGDLVTIIVRDATSPTTQNLTITAVDPASKTITVNASLSAGIATALGAGDAVDMIYRGFSSDTATQQRWAFVGGDTVIDSTSTATRQWGP